ncbi:Holliday junction branch migration protein RuvA [Patescibacteria group bacterium]|nr:Holliday junction branch migration protein RuvA [Patescibacteria group bacterium]MBU1472716.1 Holliday junction branch migration protein RuvA [Patescibacteria group bacterium]MBU2459983.1 Holliday junction branch migration protein RuvA [Patescibacteria group bacterium]MBU2544359.1 Holliday junction branch migration protein RuvA [Patescibacteria group bacterium]
MIGALTGTVFYKTANPIILDVGGVGYAVHLPPNQIDRLAIGAKHTFFVHTYVREDAMNLYGFRSREELVLFELLLTVAGIGPRTALLVVDRGVKDTTKAIVESDVAFFTTIPRLGKKNAQKIIIELKSKVGSVRDLDLSDTATGETKEILDALLSMGFDRKEAIAAIRKLTAEDTNLEQKIRHALKLLG